MKGFKNSSRMSSGFKFPSSAGFTSSTGKIQNISYSRKTPQRRAKFAEGGKVDSSLVSFKGDSELNMRHGPTGGLRPGFADGGRPKSPPKPAPKPTPEKKASTVDILKGNVRRQREADLGLQAGGMPRYAKGGRIPAERIAAREARAALSKHVAAPAPKGHKGLKSC